MRKAKIVDTIGPATESLEGITSLVEAGMDVARLNRSHGTPEDHLKVYNNLRAAAKATGRNVAALVDLQGPKIRCGWFKKNADGEDKVQLTEGQEFVITTDDIEGDEHITSTTFKGLPGDCHAGDPILIDDGKVRLEVTKVEGNNVYTKVVVAGPVSSHKGINLPGVAVSLPALTEKDEEDLRWAIRTGADIIAMSFVRFATDIDRAHEIMDEEGRRIPVVAKIEKPQALENLEEIVKAFDGIMVARGDMAVECPLEEVPLATKRCIELARQYAKPVIVATEVLGSMVIRSIGVENEVKTRVAVACFLLANIFLGIIGTFWFRTEYRKGEMGLRMALGSTRRQLNSIMVGEGVLLLVLAFIPSLLISFNIAHMDLIDTYQLPFTWLRFAICGGITFVLIVLMIICGVWYPARSTARLEPAEALCHQK